MGITYALIGIGEGVVTVLVVAYIAEVRPDIISKSKWATTVASS
jgi:ABC-type Co2+ transport system permease subunit